MKTLGALFAFALLAGSAEASSISLGESKGLGEKNSDSPEFSSWSRLASEDYGLGVRFQYSMGDEKDGFSFLVLDAKRGAESGKQEAILGVEFTRGFGGRGKGDDEGRWLEDVISLRGPGFGLIATTGDFEAASMRVDEGWKKLLRKKSGEDQEPEVLVDRTQLRDGRLPVVVMMKGEDGERVMVARYDAFREVSEYYGGAENIPSEMNIGFSGTTGGPGSFVTSSFSMVDAGTATPEPSTLVLGLGGALVAVGVRLRRRRG